MEEEAGTLRVMVLKRRFFSFFCRTALRTTDAVVFISSGDRGSRGCAKLDILDSTLSVTADLFQKRNSLSAVDAFNVSCVLRSRILPSQIVTVVDAREIVRLFSSQPTELHNPKSIVAVTYTALR
jgi:hypothetical protein